MTMQTSNANPEPSRGRRQGEPRLGDRPATRHTFLDDVADLEAIASTPPLVGEVTAWCHRMSQALEGLLGPRDDLQDRDGRVRREAAREDPQLNARLQDLGRREAIVTEQLHHLLTEAEHLEQESKEERPDEPYQQARHFRIDILAWCVAARAIEGELQTAFLESLYRDRGSVD